MRTRFTKITFSLEMGATGNREMGFLEKQNRTGQGSHTNLQLERRPVHSYTDTETLKVPLPLTW